VGLFVCTNLNNLPQTKRLDLCLNRYATLHCIVPFLYICVCACACALFAALHYTALCLLLHLCMCQRLRPGLHHPLFGDLSHMTKFGAWL